MRHKDFPIWAAAAFAMAIAPMVAGAIAQRRDRAEACAWTHDPDPHWSDGRPMSAEDCRYMASSGEGQ
jgi:hypothetical protein